MPFKTTLNYWDLPKETKIKIGLQSDRPYVSLSLTLQSCSSFQSIAVVDPIFEEMLKKAHSMKYIGIEHFATTENQKRDFYCTNFELDFHFPDLVKILEVLEKRNNVDDHPTNLNIIEVL